MQIIKEHLKKTEMSFWISLVILSSILFGIGFFYTFLCTVHITLPYKTDNLGIISASTLLKYPKEQDFLIYIAGILCAIFIGLICFYLWLILAKLFSTKSFPVKERHLKILALAFLPLGLCFHNSLTHPGLLAVLYPVILFIMTVIISYFIIRNPIHSRNRFVKTGLRPVSAIRPISAHGTIIDFILIPLVIVAVYYSPVPRYTPIENSWSLMAEEGQYLAWIQSILNGGFQGRDFFCLYGPLRVLSIIPFVKIFGVNYFAFRCFILSLIIVSSLVIYIAVRKLIQIRIISLFVFILIMKIASSDLRVGLGLLALAYAVSAMKICRNRSKTCLYYLLGGIISGIALFYSQEVGICSIISSFICIWIIGFTEKSNIKEFLGESALFKKNQEHRAKNTEYLKESLKKSALYFSGILFGTMPALIYFGLNGALVDMLKNVFLYPLYVSKGYGADVIPSIKPYLPHNFSLWYYIQMFFSFSNDNHFVWYQPAFIYSLSVIYLTVKWFLGRLNKDDITILVLVIFGTLLFRSALGRSDESHLKYTFAPVIILYVIYMTKCLNWLFIKDSENSGETPSFILKKALAGLFIIFFLIAGNAHTAINFIDTSISAISARWFEFHNSNHKYKFQTPVKNLEPSQPSQLARAYVPVSANGGPVVETVKFIVQNTNKNDFILAIPNNGAFYFLCDRPNATHFALFSQIVTNEHRIEVLRDIKNKKPAAIIYDSKMWRVDYIPDSMQFGEALQYIKNNYRIVKIIDPFVILFPK